jgi:hypothetical protein
MKSWMTDADERQHTGRLLFITLEPYQNGRLGAVLTLTPDEITPVYSVEYV